ncbi:hypothetical protein ACHQM5_023813 [Ranunculus cassubicifolius]
MADSGNNRLLSIFSEGISRICSQWTAVQLAVINGCGGRFSHRKLELLASDVLSYFTQSKDPIFKDDLAEFLHLNVLDYFNMVLEDGSHVEVAAELLKLHKDLLRGSLESIERLRKKPSACEAVSKSKAMVTETNGVDNDDSSSDDDYDDNNSSDDGTSLIVEKCHDIKENCNAGASDMAVDEEGWSLMSSRRNKGKRH